MNRREFLNLVAGSAAALVTPSSGLGEHEINAIIEDAKKHADEDKLRAEFVRARARLEGLVDSNQKTFNEFGSMLAPDQQSEVRNILEEARKSLESGNATECLEALEKIAEMGKILSEVILYDLGSMSGSDSTEAEPTGEN